MDELKNWLAGCMGALLVAIHPWAATGAAFGCCFFLAMPSAYHGRKRVLLGIFSWGIGYGAGVYFYGGGPPYSDKAMLVAAGWSALAVTAFLAWRKMIEADRDLPPWMKSVLPFLKRRGANDGDGN